MKTDAPVMTAAATTALSRTLERLAASKAFTPDQIPLILSVAPDIFAAGMKVGSGLVLDLLRPSVSNCNHKD